MLAETLSPVMSDALVILGAAGIIIPLFTRFRVTPIIGFILVGILVGPYGLGRFVYDHEWLYYVTISDPVRLEPFAEFGIILLLFSIGLELSFGRLWKMRKLVFGLGALELVVLGSLIAAFLAIMGQYWTGAVALGLALAMSSTAVVLPISGTKTPVGQAALSMLLFEGIALVPIIFLLGAMAPYADGGDGLSDTIWLGIVVLAGMMILGRLVLPYLFAQAARTKSPELFLAVSLLVVISASLATSFAGLSPIVGALLAGLLIAETEYASDVAAILEPFRGLALGIFLLTVGMTIDLRMVWENAGGIVIALAAVLALKAAITIVLLHMMGARKSTATEAGILMASPSEDTLIIIAAASAAMLIQPGTAQFWQIVTSIGLMLTPLLALAGRIAARRVEPHADRIATPERQADGQRVIILGCGRVGRLVADMLAAHGRPYIALDSNPDLVERSKRDGYPAVFGNAARTGILEKLGVEQALAVVFTMDEPILTQRTIKKLRKDYPDLPIVARARDTAHAAELYRVGATTAVPETLESSLQLSEAVLVDLGAAIGPVIASIHEERAEFRDRIRKTGISD
jgi:CPA2 family monovalent cation:H+ antiporter-2